VIIDKNLKIPVNTNCFQPEVKTIVINQLKQSVEDHLHFEQVSPNIPLHQQLIEILNKHKIQSIIIEGGANTLTHFIKANLWDEATVYKSPNNLEKGISAPTLSQNIYNTIQIETDQLYIYKND
jgi:diaminohydroxyphosphoribosylaminopyrimidine deaminase/5-amino-6-(5-phosphoribosylamino)uracil reductase